MMNCVKKLFHKFFKEPSLSDIAKKEPPNQFYRGLSSQNDFTQEGYISGSAFEFHDHTSERNDEYWETSINWNDSPDSLKTLMSLKSDKTQKLMFDCYSYLLISQLRSSFALLIENKHLKYERKPLKDNIYHGNILVLGSLDKKTKTLIKNNLAMIATHNMNNMRKVH